MFVTGPLLYIYNATIARHPADTLRMGETKGTKVLIVYDPAVR